MNVAFQTFGCRLNRAEALDHEARLLAKGHVVVPLNGATPPDLIVVRGCSVTAKAERDCRKAIDRLRSRFPSARIEITGCLANPTITQSHNHPTPQSPNPIPLRTARAYLKIQDGCSGRCAFCIVPSFRGKPRSAPLERVLPVTGKSSSRAATWRYTAIRDTASPTCLQPSPPWGQTLRPIGSASVRWSQGCATMPCWRRSPPIPTYAASCTCRSSQGLSPSLHA